MAGLLGDIFSAGNVAKRKLTDLLGNPILSAQQMLGNLNDRARVLNEMTTAAAREGVSYGPSSQQLAGLLSEAYNPVGMTLSKGSTLTPNTLKISAPLDDLSKVNQPLPTDYYELNSMATQAYSDLRANPSLEAKNRYMELMKARDEAANNPSKSYTPPVPHVASQGYKGEHQAPTKDSGAPLWNLKDIYPDDFYSYQGARFYGDGADTGRDKMIVSQIQSMRNRPDKIVTIYRAVPKDVPTKEALNVGDWVTLDRQYAKEHGEGALNGDYKIVKKTVKARDLFTNGDSIYEMGYDPQPFKTKRELNLLD